MERDDQTHLLLLLEKKISKRGGRGKVNWGDLGYGDLSRGSRNTPNGSFMSTAATFLVNSYSRFFQFL
jgi:hypothetical protein